MNCITETRYCIVENCKKDCINDSSCCHTHYEDRQYYEYLKRVNVLERIKRDDIKDFKCLKIKKASLLRKRYDDKIKQILRDTLIPRNDMYLHCVSYQCTKVVKHASTFYCPKHYKLYLYRMLKNNGTLSDSTTGTLLKNVNIKSIKDFKSYPH